MKLQTSFSKFRFWASLSSLILSSSFSMAVTPADFKDTSESGNYTLSNMRLFTTNAQGQLVPFENGTVFKGSQISATVEISANIPGTNGWVSVNNIAKTDGVPVGGACTTYTQVQVNEGAETRYLSMGIDTSLAGVVTVYAFVTPYFCNAYGYQYLWSNILTRTLDVLPLTAEFKDVKVAQTIVRPITDPLPLIEGKSSSFSTTVEFNNPSNTGNFWVDVYANGSKIAQTGLIAFESGKTAYEISPEKFARPGGASYVVTTVAPQTSVRYEFRVVKENIETLPNGFVVPVVKTYAPVIGIVPILCQDVSGSGCYENSSGQVVQTFLNQKDYLSDLFPVADNSIKISLVPEPVFGADKLRQRAIRADFVKLMKIKKTTLSPASDGLVPYNRILAIAAPDYFKYHGEDADVCGEILGDTVDGVDYYHSVGTVSASCAPTFAHELGHTFSLDHYSHNHPLSILTEGYNARTKMLVKDNRVGAAVGSYNFMKSLDKSFDVSKNWINASQYKSILQQILNPLVDPKVIYFGGLIEPNGSIKIIESGVSETGVIDEQKYGDVEVQSVDISGNVLNSISVNTNVFVETEYSDLEVDKVRLDSAPFLVTLPFAEAATKINVVKAGKVLSSTSIGFITPDPAPSPTPTPTVAPSPSPSPTVTPSPSPSPTPQPAVGSMVEVVKLIPDKAYKILPALAKLVLNLEAKLFDSLVASKKYSQALVLLSLIEAELKLGLKDSYSVTGNQLTKTQLMQRIAAIKTSLKSR